MDNLPIKFPEEQEDLVMEIRNGNKEAIHELVDSYETMLLEMIEAYAKKKNLQPGNPEKILAAAKQELLALSKKELNNAGKHLFLPFHRLVAKGAVVKAFKANF